MDESPSTTFEQLWRLDEIKLTRAIEELESGGEAWEKDMAYPNIEQSY